MKPDSHLHVRQYRFDSDTHAHMDLDRVGGLRAFEDLPLPFIVNVHRVARGGGFELAPACGLTVTAAWATFGLGAVPAI